MRFELTTPTLARLCSTPELRPLKMGNDISLFNQTTLAGNRSFRQNCPEQKIKKLIENTETAS